MPKAEFMGLFSGGLDSLLAARLLARQGARFELVHFETGFVWASRAREVERSAGHPERSGCVKLHRLEAGDDYRRAVSQRGAGFAATGRCADCRVWMLGEAKRLARRRDIPFLFTGEVLGQGSTGQRRDDFDEIDRRTSLSGRVLRPLSARLLPPSDAEDRGRVDRSKLGRVHGRARRGQLALARSLGVEEPPAPASGCCWLADPHFGRRLRDRLSHGGEPQSPSDIARLKVGRHFRLAWDLKAIVARNEAESRRLAALAEGELVMQVASARGAIMLVEGPATDEQLRDLAGLAVRYSAEREGPAAVTVRRAEENLRQVTAPPSDPKQLADWRI
jgi:hypothetical protein